MLQYQWWRYSFAHPDGAKYIYAISEKHARKKFKRAFGIDAGELLSRKPW